MRFVEQGPPEHQSEERLTWWEKDLSFLARLFLELFYLCLESFSVMNEPFRRCWGNLPFSCLPPLDS